MDRNNLPKILAHGIQRVVTAYDLDAGQRRDCMGRRLAGE